jgi:DNA-binding CsgD family transcriptional regulator/sugar-specific transcriptional regulator TrmB
VFEAAGLGTIEEELYDLLLDVRELSLAELVETRAEPPVVLTRAMEHLESSGLVTRAAGPPVRYAPSPPDLAIEALVLRRHGELEQLRAHAATLARKYRAAERSDSSALVQVVRGAEAVRQHALQVQRAARHEVAIIDRPPYAAGGGGFNDEELTALRRGVRYRCIYDAGQLSSPRTADVFRYIEAGEQARTLLAVPVKMLVADGEVAIVPLDLDEPEFRDCAIVRGSTLISALTTCFEALWARSVAVSSGARAESTDLEPAGQAPSALERRIVRMLAAGVKDEAIARHLEVSTRTINRYMDRIMSKLGATTRFQAGLQATRHGWL